MDYAGTFNPFGSGDATISYRIHNTGNAVLSAQADDEGRGPVRLGVDRGRASSRPSPELLPGESWQMSVPVKGVAPAFRLAATTVLMPLLTDASGSTTSLEPVSVTADAWALPWTQLALLVVLIAIVVGWFVLMRGRRSRRKEREDARVREARRGGPAQRRIASPAVVDERRPQRR